MRGNGIMAGLLLLHITSLLLWVAALLYLPLLLTTRLGDEPATEGSSLRHAQALARALFMVFASPVALLVIVSGTAIFLTQAIVAPWLVIKLLLVVGLVLCHGLLGWLLLRADTQQPPAAAGYALCVASATLAGAIFWCVLAKPLQEADAWLVR